MDEKKNGESKDINDITSKLMRNIEDGLSSIDVDIGDVESYKEKQIDREDLEEKYQEATRNLKIDTELIEEVYEDIKKKEHDKFEEETRILEEETAALEEEFKVSREDIRESTLQDNLDCEDNYLKDNSKEIEPIGKLENVDALEDTSALEDDDTLKEVDNLEEDIATVGETIIDDDELEHISNNIYANIDSDISNEEQELEPVKVEKVKFEYRQNPIVALYSKVKRSIDDFFAERRRRKTHNGAMSKVLVAVSCVFFTLIVYIAYYVLIESKDRLNNPYNERSLLMEETVLRGSIYSSDQKILAQTIKVNGEWKRYYPYGTLFSHVVGRYDKGKTGIELGNDYDLLTTDDTQIEKIIHDINDEKSKGNSILTTLDYGLQKVADKALGNRNGAVVAIEPSTGKILAMVSKPDYDPNYIAENWEKYSNADNSENALLNRATQGRYAPGSTFKVVTALELMREKNYREFSYNCTGMCTIDGHNTRCYNTKVHGMQGLEAAFANSCNTAFANIGLMLNITKYNKTCEQLLFNKDLPYDYLYKGSSFDLVKGSKDTLKVDTAIGQGKTQITPLHNALIVSAIANKGVLMKPHLVYKMVTDDMDVKEIIQPKKVATIMSESESMVLRKMMESVVENGTAKNLRNNNYTAAGKTGSAEYDETNNSHAWFIGYAPANNPQIAVSIIVEKAGTGGTHAVPIAKQLFDQYLK